MIAGPALKNAGFSLSSRKKLETGAGPVNTLSASVKSLFGASWEFQIDWATIGGITDEAKQDKVIKVLFEVVVPGINSDLTTMGTEELAGLAAESKTKVLEVAFGDKTSAALVGGHLKYTFALSGVVSYPEGAVSVRHFILETCAGCDDPSTVLPASSLKKSSTTQQVFKVVFEAPPPLIAIKRGWIGSECSVESINHTRTHVWINTLQIVAIRAVPMPEGKYGSQIITTNGHYWALLKNDAILDAVFESQKLK
jgi:hypothetical protein